MIGKSPHRGVGHSDVVQALWNILSDVVQAPWNILVSAKFVYPIYGCTYAIEEEQCTGF